MKLNPLFKNFVLVVVIFFIIGGIFSLLYLPAEKPSQISFSQLVSDINQDKVKKITVSGDILTIDYSDNKISKSMKESGSAVTDQLINLGAGKENLQKI